MKVKNKKVLMCEPRHFRVDYVINPWMKVGSVDVNDAMRQWENLKSVYENLGVSVEVVDQRDNLPDMVFSADCAVVVGNCALMSRFMYSQRQPEAEVYKGWFERNGFGVFELSEGSVFEGGGDSLWQGERLLVGTGWRTSMKVCNQVSEILDAEVVCLELTNPNFYHLDTCLLVIDQKTAFYYPEAFSDESRNKLKSLFVDIHELSEEEASGFVTNSVRIEDTLVVPTGNEGFNKRVQALGLTVKNVDVGEFVKAGGGIHCLTNIITKLF